MPTNLPLPKWEETRSIYKKLSAEFHVLTESYALAIDDRTKLMLDHLILGIDEVDLVVDKLPDLDQRNGITDSILDYLNNDDENWKHHLANESLTIKIQHLKWIVRELNVQNRFHTAATNIFKYTEEKRHVLDEKELIKLIQLEGKATAELPLSILQIEQGHAFATFFTTLCMMMGIADLVIDARSDYKDNYIALKPKFSLYLKLISILMKDGIRLVWNFPKKFRFLKYCLKFSYLLATAKE